MNIEALFNHAKSKNPELTREKFDELREDAIAQHPVSGKDLVDVGGGVMMDASSLTAEELNQLKKDEEGRAGEGRDA